MRKQGNFRVVQIYGRPRRGRSPRTPEIWRFEDSETPEIRKSGNNILRKLQN